MKKITGLLTCLFATIMVAAAQENNNTFTYKIGNAEIILLSEGQQNGRTNILIGATPEMLQQCAPKGTFPNATNAFLVRTPDKTILVDAGYGKNLFNNLQTVGVTAEQIDIILITHMHGDHIGGLLRDDKAAFPNAKLYVAKPEYEYWTSKDNASTAVKAVNAYQKTLTLFEPGAFEKLSDLLPGISTIAAYGHTPGHTLFLLKSNNEQLLIWGDLTHAMAVQMPYPQVAVTYDTDPEQAIASRQQILAYVAKNNIPIAGMHIAFPGIGKVAGNDKGGYLFTPATK